jgi:hypothetical protein
MVYDYAHRQIVLFGGLAVNPFADTWTYDGTTWTKLSTLNSPPARSGHGLAYDRGRNKVVLFGGYNGSSLLADTWEFDGSDWTPITPQTSPPGRRLLGMTYDATRGRVIIFGGLENGDGNDTWDYDGTTWSQLATTAQPPPRHGPVMIYDDVARRDVLFGGSGLALGTFFADTWALTAAGWEQLAVAGPGARGGAAGAYDTLDHRLVMYGGTRNNQQLVDTWFLHYFSAAPTEVCTANIDADGDMKSGCHDAECAIVCNGTCGDGTCVTGYEDCFNCPDDCGVMCASVCGDGLCNTATESAVTCPGDCP